jgi:thioredoxin-like negative regulator of GroEL
MCSLTSFAEIIAALSILLFQIQAVPTVIAMRKGQVMNQFMGVLEDDLLESFIEEHVGHSAPKS